MNCWIVSKSSAVVVNDIDLSSEQTYSSPPIDSLNGTSVIYPDNFEFLELIIALTTSSGLRYPSISSIPAE